MRTLAVCTVLALVTAATQAQPPCPVKVTRGRIVAENSLADTVHITFTNVTTVAIRAVSFEVYKTDQFGDTYEPTDENMAYEHRVLPKKATSGEWDDVLFDRMWERNDTHSKPGRFIVGVDRIAFADGKVLEAGSPELASCYVGF